MNQSIFNRRKEIEDFFVCGLDGCKDGWLLVKLWPISRKWKLEIINSIYDLWKEKNHGLIAVIDMPIGLPHTKETTRKCDTLARKLLTGERSSSVFPVPCRSAVYSDNYSNANELNKHYIGKGLSKQAWNISSKIRELDMFLLGINYIVDENVNENVNENLDEKELALRKSWLKESHPEVAFWGLNGGKTAPGYKKTEKGQLTRLSILRNTKLFENFFLNGKELRDFIKKRDWSRSVLPDDIIDAAALACVAFSAIIHLFNAKINIKHEFANLKSNLLELDTTNIDILEVGNLEHEIIKELKKKYSNLQQWKLDRIPRVPNIDEKGLPMEILFTLYKNDKDELWKEK